MDEKVLARAITMLRDDRYTIDETAAQLGVSKAELTEALSESEEKREDTPEYKLSEFVLGAKPVIAEEKLLSDLGLTPEQMQAQQDAYDQWTAPSVEPVDFDAERDAYLGRRQIREEIVDGPRDHPDA